MFKPNQVVIVLSRNLMLALNWLEYLSKFEHTSGGSSLSYGLPPKQNQWGFTNDEKRLTSLLKLTLELDPKVPSGLTKGVYVGSWSEYYSKWKAHHQFFKDNAVLQGLTCDIKALFPVEGNDQNSIFPQDDAITGPTLRPSQNDRFLNFIHKLTLGHLKLNQLLATSDPKHVR